MNRVQIVGVLNVTPDSYVDGGRFVTVETAVARAGELLAQGADIIDIGGESTGPNAPDVPEAEEVHRVIPIIQAVMQAYPQARLSIDTYKSAVAEQAVAAGVTMINDVTAGRSDPRMFAVAAEADVPLVLMFSKDATPRTTVATTQYDDVVAAVTAFLKERADAAVAAGVKRERIILDPGMGHFVSSDAHYSLQLIARLGEIARLGYPVFMSPSRKSFLAGSENLTTADRLPGTIAASAIAVLHGASYIRTHDVLEVRRGCEVAEEISKN